MVTVPSHEIWGLVCYAWPLFLAVMLLCWSVCLGLRKVLYKWKYFYLSPLQCCPWIAIGASSLQIFLQLLTFKDTWSSVLHGILKVGCFWNRHWTTSNNRLALNITGSRRKLDKLSWCINWPRPHWMVGHTTALRDRMVFFCSSFSGAVSEATNCNLVPTFCT